MISGDGNFHLQSYSRYGGEHQSPSVFGDFGFWVPYEIAKKYTEWADSQKSYASVRFNILWCGQLQSPDYALQESGSCDTQAGNFSRERSSKNLRVTGSFAMMCDHGLYLSHGIIDFKKGER